LRSSEKVGFWQCLSRARYEYVTVLPDQAWPKEPQLYANGNDEFVYHTPWPTCPECASALSEFALRFGQWNSSLAPPVEDADQSRAGRVCVANNTDKANASDE
jgi:hypothetical protein